MSSSHEKILVLGGDERWCEALAELLRGGGYEVTVAALAAFGGEPVPPGTDLLLLEADLADAAVGERLARLKGAAATRDVRLLLLCGGGAGERARGLDLGADDVLSRPAEPAELLARVRVQLRARRAQQELREKMRLAEQGQQIAHTAFQALAVTEKMTRDAFTLDRALKFGLAAILLVAVVMAAIYFRFSRRAETESRRAYAVISQLQSKQEDLLERTRRMREEFELAAADSMETQKEELQKRTDELEARIASAKSGEVAALRKELADTGARLRRIETQGKVAQGIIRNYAPSTCLLHVVVAFRHQATGRRLRYAGLNPQGQPIQDSEGNPVYDLEGRGPEVRADFFGTGFLVAADRVLTNRHVVEPWWKDEELNSVGQQGFEPVIAELSAYFPDAPRPFRVEIQKVSPQVDLAVVQGNLAELKRPVPARDGRGEAAVSGQPVVLLGYPTGLDAILARAGEDTVRSIVTSSGGNPRQIMSELARRSLVRPISTQGHIGDVSPDKIVYDAQTTMGGSGGPLFNAQGRVIGVNYAVVRGFGGSNFGIPIRYVEPLLAR